MSIATARAVGAPALPLRTAILPPRALPRLNSTSLEETSTRESTVTAPLVEFRVTLPPLPLGEPDCAPPVVASIGACTKILLPALTIKFPPSPAPKVGDEAPPLRVT